MSGNFYLLLNGGGFYYGLFRNYLLSRGLNYYFEYSFFIFSLLLKAFLKYNEAYSEEAFKEIIPLHGWATSIIKTLLPQI